MKRKKNRQMERRDGCSNLLFALVVMVVVFFLAIGITDTLNILLEALGLK